MARDFRKLSRPSIRRLVPGEKITEHGITFERMTDGDGVFSVNVMADGHRIHRVIGRESEGVTRTQAEQFIEKVRSEAREGRLSLPPGRKRPNFLSLKHQKNMSIASKKRTAKTLLPNVVNYGSI